jgi:serine/threonine-protein kinase
VHAPPRPGAHHSYSEHHLPSASEEEAQDSALARLAVERGLATADEVERCLAKKTRKKSKKPLARFLLAEKFITATQLERLEALIEAEGAQKRIPGFALLGKLGSGSAATVYRARQINLDRMVAIKVLPPKALADESNVAAFRAEARAAGQLNHPNIVQCFDVGQAGDVHYIVMEYVEGRTVHEIVKEYGPIPEFSALEIVVSVADALKHAHERGFIHRDVKPKNIILTGTDATIAPNGRLDLSHSFAKLADLGLARAMADRALAQAEAGRTLGTPYYISPEQVRGDVHIGPPSDIYSLGATFFFMLTGRPPFEAKDIDEVMHHHLHTPLTPPIELCPTLSPGVSEVIEKMMAKSEVARYPDCGELLTELRAWRAYHVLKRGETAR